MSVPELGDVPLSASDMLEDGPPPAWITHLVLRGTYLPGTVRCTAGDPFRPPSYLHDEFGDTANEFSIKCYIDIRANSYLIGSGPPTLTVKVFRYSYWDYSVEPLTDEGRTAREFIEEDRQRIETAIDGHFPGREHLLFLGPPVDLSSESWRFLVDWDVQRREDGTVIAVHPDRDLWQSLRPDDYQTHRSKLEMQLPAFTQAVTTAHEARVAEYGGRIGEGEDLPMLLTDANRLREYYTAVGAYNDKDLPPAKPPPPCGLAVSDQADNPGLMQDCMALLAARDSLRGSAALNWSVDTAITGWDGVTTGGTPSRVTKLLLASKSLSGVIPGELGDLSELIHLDLSSNSLTGDIPWELGTLSSLTEIRLSGNSLTGCIPPALHDITPNDLSSLNLLYCPPAPEGLTAGTAGINSVPLSWTAVANAAKYRVEYRDPYNSRWTVDDETITGTAHTVDGLQCLLRHQFRVSAYGDGTNHDAAWSAPSGLVEVRTLRCITPAFDEDAFTFSVLETASVGAAVGVASATDPNGDALTYTIASGNEDGNFAIDAATGAITVARELDHETTPTYNLTVEVSDGANTASVSVEINVTIPNRPPAFPSEGYSFSVNESVGLYGSVGYTVAADPDGDAVTYAITGGNTGNQFSIDLNQGLIVVRRSLDFSARSSYTLTVKATDAKGNASSATVSISVVQTAEDPPPPPTGLATSLEDAGDLIATWNEVANASMYRLRHRTDSNDEWTTSAAVTGTSRTLSSVTCGATYEVQVQAQGDGVSYTEEWSDPSESVSTAVPVCPAPVFGETSYDLTVAEDAPVGAVVGAVAANYPDQTELTYSITAGNDDGKFAIAAGGVITVAAALDHEETPAHALTVVASGPRGKSGTTTVAVTVANVNEAPSFDAEEYTFTVAEDAAVGASVGSVSANDPDEDTLTFSITAGNDEGNFSIDSSGAVTVARALDYETTTSYGLTVEATDPDGLSDTASVSIDVADVNEAPSFDAEGYTFRVPENSAIGHSVGTAAAIDPDNGDALAYSISGDVFSVGAGGAITVGAALDHESTESYSLTVTVEDESGLTDTAVVSIGVTDVNEAPSFDAAEYAFMVAENAVLGEQLGTVSATDPDADDTLAFSIDGEDFTIDDARAVTVARTLDYETAKSYSLTATVEDRDGASGTANVSITVTDVDETPAFDAEEYSFTVSEDAAVGTVVGTLTASDANERQGETLAYSVEGDAAFTIDAGAGALKVASALDYETHLTHELTVTVTDETGLTDTAVVSIRVTDVDEITPPVPGGLRADLKIREGGFDLSWNAVEGADQYRIQYRIGGSAGKWTNLEAVTGTSQRFTPEGGIRCGTRHQFRVQAHGDGQAHPARWGSRSTSVAAYQRACSEPKAPTGLTATVENGAVVLSWTAPAGSEITAYQVLRRRPGIESQLLVLVENTGGTATTYTDSPVEAGVHYIYRVKAINNSISGPISNPAEVRIPR